MPLKYLSLARARQERVDQVPPNDGQIIVTNQGKVYLDFSNKLEDRCLLSNTLIITIKQNTDNESNYTIDEIIEHYQKGGLCFFYDVNNNIYFLSNINIAKKEASFLRSVPHDGMLCTRAVIRNQDNRSIVAITSSYSYVTEDDFDTFQTELNNALETHRVTQEGRLNAFSADQTNKFNNFAAEQQANLKAFAEKQDTNLENFKQEINQEVTIVALSQYYSASHELHEGYGTCIVMHNYPEYENQEAVKQDSNYEQRVCLVFDMGNDNGATLRRYLDEKYISKINALYISHFHSDHYQPQAIKRLLEGINEETPIGIDYIYLPHGGLNWGFFIDNCNSLIKAEDNTPVSSLSTLLSLGLLPIEGYDNLLKNDLKTGRNVLRLLGNTEAETYDYYNELTYDTELNIPGFDDDDSAYEEFFKTLKHLTHGNATQFQYNELINGKMNYQQGLKALVNELSPDTIIIQPTEDDQHNYGPFSISCHNVSQQKFIDNGYLNWYYNQWQNPLMRQNSFTTIEYLSGLDEEWDLMPQETQNEYGANIANYIKAKFHWQRSDYETWKSWAPTLWGADDWVVDKWDTVINKLVFKDSAQSQPRNITELAIYIKQLMDNSPGANAFYDPSRAEGDSAEETKPTANVDSIGLTFQHYQQLYSSIMGPDSTRWASTNYNNFSMINVVNVLNKRIVVTGDIMLPAIKANLDVIREADIIVIPHHGLDTSFPQEAIDNLHAKYAILTSAYDSSYSFARQRLSHAFAGELLKNNCIITSTFCGWYPGFNDYNLDGKDDGLVSENGKYTYLVDDLNTYLSSLNPNHIPYTVDDLLKENPQIGQNTEHAIFKLNQHGIMLKNTPSYAGTARYPVTLYPGLTGTMYRDFQGETRATPAFSENEQGPLKAKYDANGQLILNNNNKPEYIYGYGDQYGFFSYAWPRFYSNIPNLSTRAENLDLLKPGEYISYSMPHAKQFTDQLPFSIKDKKFKLEVEPVSATGLAKTQRAYQVNTSAKVEELVRTQASDAGNYEPWRSFKEGTTYIDKLKNELPVEDLPTPNDYYIFENEAQLEKALDRILNEAQSGLPLIKKFSFKVLKIGDLSNVNWDWSAELHKTGNNWAIFTATCGYNHGTTIQKRCYEVKRTITLNDGKTQKEFAERKWSPIEFINPSYQNGVEYRTAERLFTNPIYTQVLEINDFISERVYLPVEDNKYNRTNQFIWRRPPQKDITIIRIEVYQNGIPITTNINIQPANIDMYRTCTKAGTSIEVSESDTIKQPCDVNDLLFDFLDNNPTASGVDTYIKIYYYYPSYITVNIIESVYTEFKYGKTWTQWLTSEKQNETHLFIQDGYVYYAYDDDNYPLYHSIKSPQDDLLYQERVLDTSIIQDVGYYNIML